MIHKGWEDETTRERICGIRKFQLTIGRNFNEIKVLQWNCQSIKKILPELQHRAEKFDVIILSETWHTRKDKVYIKGFDVIRWERHNRSGSGVAIFIKNCLKYKKVSNLYNCSNSIELCAIELFADNDNLTVVSCYRPPDKSMTGESWGRFLSQFQGRFLIAGDLNAHHLAWDDQRTCTEGRKLIEAIEETEVCFLNKEMKTFYSRQYGTESAIDISLVDGSSFLSCNWKVGDDSWGSDHFPFLLS
jgi:exonuclease III